MAASCQGIHLASVWRGPGDSDVPPKNSARENWSSLVMTRPGKLSRRRLEVSACVVRLVPELPAYFELM